MSTERRFSMNTISRAMNHPPPPPYPRPSSSSPRCETQHSLVPYLPALSTYLYTVLSAPSIERSHGEPKIVFILCLQRTPERAAEDLALYRYIILSSIHSLCLPFHPCPPKSSRLTFSYSYGRLVRCDIPAPRTAASRLLVTPNPTSQIALISLTL